MLKLHSYICFVELDNVYNGKINAEYFQCFRICKKGESGIFLRKTSNLSELRFVLSRMRFLRTGILYESSIKSFISITGPSHVSVQVSMSN